MSWRLALRAPRVRRWLFGAGVLVIATLIVTPAVALGMDEIKWLGVLKEVGGWGVACVAIFFLNHGIEKREKDWRERENQIVEALRETSRISELLSGSLRELTGYIRDRREGLDNALGKIGADTGRTYHYVANLEGSEPVRHARALKLVEDVAECKRLLVDMVRRNRERTP